MQVEPTSPPPPPIPDGARKASVAAAAPAEPEGDPALLATASTVSLEIEKSEPGPPSTAAPANDDGRASPSKLDRSSLKASAGPGTTSFGKPQNRIKRGSIFAVGGSGGGLKTPRDHSSGDGHSSASESGARTLGDVLLAKRCAASWRKSAADKLVSRRRDTVFNEANCFKGMAFQRQTVSEVGSEMSNLQDLAHVAPARTRGVGATPTQRREDGKLANKGFSWKYVPSPPDSGATSSLHWRSSNPRIQAKL